MKSSYFLSRYAAFAILFASAIATAANAPYFSQPKTYNAALPNHNTNAIAVADVNGDGNPDLVVGDDAGDQSGNIGVLLGNGHGIFRIAHLFASGGHTITSVATGDFNGDGKIDVAVSQQEGVAVLLGNGNGTFQPPQTYAINSLFGSSGVAIADLNGDGKPDLLVSIVCDPNFTDCNHQGSIGVMLGNGDGTFGVLQFYSSGGYYPTAVVVADINRDGKLDLAVDNSLSLEGTDHGSVGVLLGNGNGTFQNVVNYDQGGFNGGSLTVADLNGDGNPDIISANSCANNNCNLSTIGVLLGKGDGTFQDVKVTVGVGGWSAIRVAATDVNGDAIPDLLVANICDNSTVCDHGTVGLLLGQGDGTFSQKQTYSSGGVNADSLAIADVNGDGIADVFVANGSSICCASQGVVGVLLSRPPTKARSRLAPVQLP